MADTDQIWEHSKAELQTLPQFLSVFLRHPLNGIRVCPNWQWPTILILLGSLSMISGALAGLVDRSFVNFLVGLFIFPLSSILIIAVGSSFFYYVFLLFLKREVPFKGIYTLMVLAAIPFLIFRIASVVPPIQLVGLAFSAALVIVGFTENFHLPRRFVSRLVVGIYVVLLGYWVAQQISLQQRSFRPKKDVTPESWKILEQEIKKTDTE